MADDRHTEKPDRRLQREQAHHTQAFETYYGLGTKRRYRDVANQLGLSVSAIRLMARSFNWSTRLQERDATVARQAADNVIGSAVANATRNRKMVELALMKVIKAINSDKVRIQVGDLDRLLRLQAFLDGDGVTPSPETLRERPLQEVYDAFVGWMHLLTDDQLRTIIAKSKEDEDKAAAPAATPPVRPASAVPEGPNPTEKRSSETGEGAAA